MTRRLTARWWSPAAAADRQVLTIAVAVRLAAVCLLGILIPLGWSHQRSHGWSLLLAVGLAVETAVVIAWWLSQGRLDPRSLMLDLPTGAAAMVATAHLADRAMGWTGYVLVTGYGYPYTVVIAVVLGFTLRSLPTSVLCGLVWDVTELVAAVAAAGYVLVDVLFVLGPHMLMAGIGCLGGRLFCRGVAYLAASREHAAAQAAQLAKEHERVWRARALHDRLLQTLEVLSRDRLIDEEDLHSGIVAEAAWFRRFVETGELDQDEDLPAALAAATRAAAASGVPVELNDAGIRTAIAPDLPGRSREALVLATHRILEAFVQGAHGAVVHAEPECGGVLVTILALGSVRAPDLADLDGVRACLADVGGRFKVEPVPYAELWVPGERPT